MNTLRASAGVLGLWIVFVGTWGHGRETPAAPPASTPFVQVADGPLYFTRQVTPHELSADAPAQVREVLGRLIDEVVGVGGKDATIARVNAYVADEADVPAVESAIAARFGAKPPTQTFVVTPLPVAGARVAFDAVALVTAETEAVRLTASGGAVLPSGAKVFLSGLVERGEGMAAGAGRTMDGLGAMLDHLGLGWGDVAQIKVFLQPFAERATAEREIAARFGGRAVPPVIWVEWVQNQPAEIELVASGRALKAAPVEALSFPDFPGRTRSPRYSHAAVVAAGTPLIFLDGLTPRAGLAPREQWKDVFTRMGTVLFDSGSGFRYLVKATYYTSDAEARRVLNEIRAVYYDPARPPAASAIGVRSTGQAGANVNVDLIAVPHPGPR